jgi:hypothetical protein
MTAHALTTASTGVGGGARGRIISLNGSQPLKCKVLDYDMGTDNYTAGGNDISAIWTSHGFKDVFYIGIEQKDTNTAADQRMFAVDYTAKTLLQYDALNTEETASDQGVVALRLFVVGI